VALGRIVGFLAVAGVAIGLLELLVTLATGRPPRGEIASVTISTVALLVATALFVRGVDKNPWSAVWLDRDAARPRTLALGFAIGAFAIGVPTALLIVAHWLAGAPASSGSWVAAAISSAALLLPAALLEELATRGYVLSVLRDAWGWGAAVTVTSIVFGLLHLMNNGVNFESVVLVTLAGFFLAAVLYATKSLYAAWMAHFAWNWTMAAVFHVAVSGIPLETPNYRYVDAGPDWATGGVWGPEGGIPAGIGMLAAMAFLYAVRNSRLAIGSRFAVRKDDSLEN
jgi:membrane protease YdiL (CAAX protease family)